MRDLRIVIVSWNVAGLLERCLLSLPQACRGLDWDCVVVDNNSSDNSVDLVKRIMSEDARIDLLVNKENLGFAQACNQGATQHQASYVLLLNPDTECPPDSISALVRTGESKPLAGVIGPKIVYPDGRYQESVRRFPGLLDQSLILLKLHHFLPRLKSLEKYFCRDLLRDKGQSVDQVMGACFMVRGQCWDALQGLDPRYFIWYEEVDFCKQAVVNGWTVWYEPSIKVVHHGGQSFDKAFTLRKQKYLNASLRKYMLKWHGRWAWLIVTILHPMSLLLAGLVSVVKLLGADQGLKNILKSFLEKNDSSGRLRTSHLKNFGFWIGGIMVLELLSILTLQMPDVRSFLAVLAGLVLVVIAYKRPPLALLMVAVELLIGGFGYLLNFALDGQGLGISLRMIVFGAFMAGWGLNAIKYKIWRYWRLKELLILQVWVFVGLMIVSGLVSGLWLRQPYIFQDINAWLFLLYFVPVLDISHRYHKELTRLALTALVAGVAWLSFKTLLVLYIFSHGLTGAAELVYLFIRDTRVGEITPAGGNLYRVFLQSGIFGLLSLVLLAGFWIDQKELQSSDDTQDKLLNNFTFKYWSYVLGVLVFGALIAGLSRSFWLGTAGGLGLALLMSAIKLRTKILPGLLSLAGVLLGGSLLMAGVVYFPWPSGTGVSMADMLISRGTVSDAAGASRWNLLPAMWDKIKQEPILGSGFGSTVAYQSLDPRILKNNVDGWHTTYAFEWGWLSLWIKFGIFGIIIMSWLLISLGWRVWKSSYAWWIRTGVVAGTFALAIVHFWTPYLDHPLGFAWILGLESLLVLKAEQENPTEWQEARG